MELPISLLAEFPIPRLFDYLATFLWAVSGAIVGMQKRYDFTGVLVIALAASTGGSLLRDGLLLNRTPPILSNGYYLPIIVSAALLIGLVRARISQFVLLGRAIAVIDAVGIPVFAIVGMQLSLDAGVPAPGVVLVGVVNGIGGGLVRDLLVGDTPAILVPGQYSISALIVVSVLFLIVYQLLGVAQVLAGWGMIGLYVLIRMASLRYDLQTHPIQRDPPSEQAAAGKGLRMHAPRERTTTPPVD